MGTIHRSMFREAMEADVYIADLSGANPNVYLELGVRWALRDAVTVLIAQDVRQVLFNAAASRVIGYGPMPEELKEAKRQITEAVVGEYADANMWTAPYVRAPPTSRCRVPTTKPWPRRSRACGHSRARTSSTQRSP